VLLTGGAAGAYQKFAQDAVHVDEYGRSGQQFGRALGMMRAEFAAEAGLVGAAAGSRHRIKAGG
jgi:hypothetical protein